MYLADSHVHTNYSFDGENTACEMCLACIEGGISEVVFTDHCELVPLFMDIKAAFDIEERQREIERLRDRFSEGLKIRSGIELGEPSENPAEADEVIKKGRFDFVLASVHSLAGVGDYYFLDFKKIPRELINKLFGAFIRENTRNAGIKGVNGIAHLDYMHRYVEEAGKSIDSSLFRDETAELFKTAISNGVAIEYNISSLVKGLPEPSFTAAYLKLYREMGGELVTVGTDAHRAGKNGKFIKEACARLAALGFKYITVFREGKPAFIATEQ